MDSQILIIALVRVAEPIAFTSLFTYVYFMVRDFGIANDEAEVAKYAVYLSSSFVMAQIVCGFNWGRFADRFSRKPRSLLASQVLVAPYLCSGLPKVIDGTCCSYPYGVTEW